MKKRFLLGIGIFFVFGLFNTAYGQLEKHEAAYIFNFTRFIKWPDSQASGDFIIGVLGKNQKLTGELTASSEGRTVGSQSIKVVEFATVEEISKCQILFVPSALSGQLRKVSAKIGSSATVIITEEMDRNPFESTINLHVVDQKLAFYINKSNADQKKIVVSEKLLTLSK